MQRNIHRVESSGYRLTIHAMIISSTHANPLVNVMYELEPTLLLYQTITDYSQFYHGIMKVYPTQQ